ncbi:hypothetical protein CSOJ01_01931 [Colletotrichum sojae]|uniref:Uncharacterized protein n=1 Tax=Colletotrichum sojae TaxID=2175907 RepID=A0A8H6JSC4_9PEZI|nr:hypothetical protein CSOJ01_01931 [Colletotrichum sojae]
MSSRTPTYLPAPNWDIPADSNVVVLGRLIRDPRDPQSKVPRSSDDPVPPPEVYEGAKTDWQTTVERSRAGCIGLWAKCLQLVGGGLSLGQLKSTMEDHRFSSLETRYFSPDEEYLARALEDAGVQAYFHVNNHRKPVYLITGVKIARGGSVSTESSVERLAQAEVKADATGFGAPVEMGPEASWESATRRTVSYGGSSDYIFAYQLTRIKPRKGGRASKSQSYVKGALYEKGGEGGAAEVRLRDVFEIEEEAGLGFADTWEQVGEDEV